MRFHVNFFSVVLDNAVSIRDKMHVSWKRVCLLIVVNNNKKVSFSFVSLQAMRLTGHARSYKA